LGDQQYHYLSHVPKEPEEYAYFFNYNAKQLDLLFRQTITGTSTTSTTDTTTTAFPWWQFLLGGMVAFSGMTLMILAMFVGNTSTTITTRNTTLSSSSWWNRHSHKASLSDVDDADDFYHYMDNAMVRSGENCDNDQDENDDANNETGNHHHCTKRIHTTTTPTTTLSPNHDYYHKVILDSFSSERGTAASQSRRRQRPRRQRQAVATWRNTNSTFPRKQSAVVSSSPRCRSRRPLLRKAQSWKDRVDEDISTGSFDPILLTTSGTCGTIHAGLVDSV
jgi:hypothetical protein